MRIPRFAVQALAIAGIGLTMLSTRAFAQDATAEAAKELPEASSLFQKCFAQMGDAEKLNALQSGACNVVPPPMMGADSATMQAMAPDKCRVDVKLMEGEAFVVANGEHLWGQGPGEPVEYGDNEEMGMIMVMMAPQFMLHSAPGRFDLKTTGTQMVGGDECYEVQLSKGGEDAGMSVLFNAKTGMCGGFTIAGPTGAPVNYVVKKWGEVDGVKVITEAALDMTAEGMGELVFGFTDYKFNGVDEKVFEMPAEVKKMADEANAADGGGAS